MKNPELNFIDRFLYKLLIGTFLLLAVIFLSRLQVINIEDVRFELGQHYNILKIIKALNGKNNFLLPIDISDSVASEVALVYDKSKKIPNGYRIELTEFQGVEAYKTGIVVEVRKNSDHTYRLKVKGIDDYEYIYDKLATVNCNIYKIVQSGEVIAAPFSQEDVNYFEFYVYNQDQPVNLFIE